MHWIFFSCPLWKIFLKEIFSKVVVCQFFHLCHQYHLIISQSPSFLLSMFNEHCSSSFPFSPLFSSFMICNARAAQLHNCTIAQLHSWTAIQLQSCNSYTIAQLQSWTAIQLQRCNSYTIVQLHSCNCPPLNQ